jgi:hypothetical protein
MTSRAIECAARLGDGWLGLTSLDALDAKAVEALLDELHTTRPAALPRPTTVLRHRRDRARPRRRGARGAAAVLRAVPAALP